MSDNEQEESPNPNEPGPAMRNVFEQIEEAAPNMMFQEASNDPREEKRAEGIRQELFACMLMATETVRMYKEAQLRPQGLDEETLSTLNERATGLAIRMNNLANAIVQQDDPRDIQGGPGNESNPDNPSDLIQP